MTRMPRLVATDPGRLRREKGPGERGFTVIELIVVLLVIGVLLAVGIPTFITYLNSSSNGTAEANLESALQGANTYYLEQTHTYTGLCTNANCSGGPGGGFASIATGLTAVPGYKPSTSPQVVSIWVSADGQMVVLTSLANDPHNCWVIVDARGHNIVLGFKAPTVLYIREKGKGNKQPVCAALAPVFRNPIRDVTRVQTGGWPPGYP